MTAPSSSLRRATLLAMCAGVLLALATAASHVDAADAVTGSGPAATSSPGNPASPAAF